MARRWSVRPPLTPPPSLLFLHSRTPSLLPSIERVVLLPPTFDFFLETQSSWSDHQQFGVPISEFDN